MIFGYIKSNNLLKDEADYKYMLDHLKVDKIFVDRYGDNTALSDLIKYVRAGDCIVVEDLSDISSSVGEFTELALKLYNASVSLVCRNKKIDTSSPHWLAILKELNDVNNNVYSITNYIRPRLYEELDNYFIRVENKEITVDEVCELLHIGRSTYYRRWRTVYKKPKRERHPELFDQYEEKVALGEITVTDACKEMGIGITTYYSMRKKKADSG